MYGPSNSEWNNMCSFILSVIISFVILLIANIFLLVKIWHMVPMIIIVWFPLRLFVFKD